MSSIIIKVLGAIAGLLILFEVAGPSVYNLFFQQYEINRLALEKVSKQLRTRERVLRQAEATTRLFSERAKLNFESDQAKARVMYQEFLVRLTDACTLNSVVINSSQPERIEELGAILHFSLQVTGTTDQFGKLIDGFYQTEALHRLSSLSIFHSLGPDSAVHSLTLDVALLVLSDDSNSEIKLNPPPIAKLKDAFASTDVFRRKVPNNNAQHQSGLASGLSMLSNIFANAPIQPPEPTNEPPMPIEMQPSPSPETLHPPVDDPKANVRLVGIIAKGSTKYAVFFDAAQKMQFAVKEQAVLEDLRIDARITEIRSNDVRLEEDKEQFELSLGSLYNEATKR